MIAPILPATIGLDYDGVVNRDVVSWLTFIAMMRTAGHRVYITTMRYPSEVNTPGKSMHPDILAAVNGVFFTSRTPKRPYVEARGVSIDIWIDDHPRAVEEHAQDVFGWVSPEASVIDVALKENHS